MIDALVARQRASRHRLARLAALLLAVASPLPWSRAAAQARLTGALEGGSNDFVLTLGPIDLPAGATHHQVAQPRAQEVTLPGPGWLRGYRVELIDGDGRPVPQAVLHHLNLIMPDRRELFSPIMLRVGAAGHETAPVQLPFLMGFKVTAGEKLLVTAMFSNEESKQAYRGVHLRVHMPFTPDGTWLPPMSVYPFYIDVMPPAGTHAYDLPAGKSSRSWDAHPAVAARILGMGGHLHQYGTMLRFEDVTAGKIIWEARPVLDRSGEVASMPTGKFWWKGGVKVVPAHLYRLTAFYENPTGHVIPEGAMGTLGGILVPARGSVWPAVNRSDPEYKKDSAVTWTGMQMDMPGMSMPGMQSQPGKAVPAAPPALGPARAKKVVPRKGPQA
ncbi:MAG TPA: hypothetical protein VF832_15640 [Longimicrobiales bacterium]